MFSLFQSLAEPALRLYGVLISGLSRMHSLCSSQSLYNVAGSEVSWLEYNAVQRPRISLTDGHRMRFRSLHRRESYFWISTAAFYLYTRC